MPPDEALDSLGQGGATLLLTCPSYLAELVTAARRRGMGPGDFRLRRVTVGGEVLSPSLAQAACQTLGVPLIEDSYSMTEVIPVTGRTCSQRHLHHDVNTGLTELLDLETGEPAAPGALGTLVITPYFPYRDCMPVFRFDTRDVARCLPEEAPRLRAGRHPRHQPDPRQGRPPAASRRGRGRHAPAAGRGHRGAARPHPGPPVTAPRPTTAGSGSSCPPPRSRLRRGRGPPPLRRGAGRLDVDLTIVGDDQATSLRQTRSDLRETTFATQHALVGA